MFAPLLPAVQADTNALNDGPSCMFFDELAWLYLNSLQLLLCQLVVFTTIRLWMLPTPSHRLPWFLRPLTPLAFPRTRPLPIGLALPSPTGPPLRPPSK